MAAKTNFYFWLHFLIVALAWVGPFLFSWRLMLIGYGIVMLQFSIFGQCKMNASHGITGENDETFYSFIFEKIGIHLNRKKLKWVVYNLMYPVLAAFTLLWQEVLGFRPLLF